MLAIRSESDTVPDPCLQAHKGVDEKEKVDWYRIYWEPTVHDPTIGLPPGHHRPAPTPPPTNDKRRAIYEPMCAVDPNSASTSFIRLDRMNGANDLDLAAKPYCECKHKQGLMAVGPGALNGFNYGPYPAQKNHALYPATCVVGSKSTECRCVPR